MLTDAQLETGIAAMLAGIDAPPASVTAIRRYMLLQQQSASGRRRRIQFPALAAAAAAVALILLPVLAPAIVQSLEARYRAALQALGGIAPPSPPKAVLSTLKSQPETLASAQKRVSFTIFPPVGLPRDIVSTTIRTVSTGTYTPATHSWKTGPMEVQFFYRRSGGREFVLIADPYDPNGEKPSKYIFDADGRDAKGRPVLIKHENFAWHNGDQLMTVTAGPDLTAAEIRNIKSAMHGLPVAQRTLHSPLTPKTMRLRVLVRP